MMLLGAFPEKSYGDREERSCEAQQSPGIGWQTQIVHSANCNKSEHPKGADEQREEAKCPFSTRIFHSAVEIVDRRAVGRDYFTVLLISFIHKLKGDYLLISKGPC